MQKNEKKKIKRKWCCLVGGANNLLKKYAKTVVSPFEIHAQNVSHTQS